MHFVLSAIDAEVSNISFTRLADALVNMITRFDITISASSICQVIIYRRFEQLISETCMEYGFEPMTFCRNDDARTTLLKSINRIYSGNYDVFILTILSFALVLLFYVCLMLLLYKI